MVWAASLVFLDEDLYRRIWDGCDVEYVMDKIYEKVEDNGISRNPLVEEIRNSSGWERYELVREVALDLVEFVRSSKRALFENKGQPRQEEVYKLHLKKR